MKSRIGIRPTIDGRWGGIREGLEEQTMGMAKAAKALIEQNVNYADGSAAEVVISPCRIVFSRISSQESSRPSME